MWLSALGNKKTSACVYQNLNSADVFTLVIPRLFAAIIAAGLGCGLTIVNNFGQIARSFGAPRISTFISLFSIWNCLGLLLAG